MREACESACEDGVMKYLAVLLALGVIFGLCNGLVRLVIILSWIATATPLNFYDFMLWKLCHASLQAQNVAMVFVCCSFYAFLFKNVYLFAFVFCPQNTPEEADEPYRSANTWTTSASSGIQV